MLSQTAGLLAYLISIHPSSTFNPLKKSLVPPSFLETLMWVSFQCVYSLAHTPLPDSIANFFPTTKDLSTAPAPLLDNPSLSPKQLKDALLDISSKGVLTNIPDDTPNLLINNATSPGVHQGLKEGGTNDPSSSSLTVTSLTTLSGLAHLTLWFLFFFFSIVTYAFSFTILGFSFILHRRRNAS